jgi:hypothetical protein
MTPEERSESARKAAEVRWGKKTPISEYAGDLTIGDMTLDCAVLPDGRRIITQKSIMTALGRSESQGRRVRNDNRPPFLEANNLTPYISPELKEMMNKVEYRIKGEKTVRTGYPAEIIPELPRSWCAASPESGSPRSLMKPPATRRSAQRTNCAVCSSSTSPKNTAPG